MPDAHKKANLSVCCIFLTMSTHHSFLWVPAIPGMETRLHSGVNQWFFWWLEMNYSCMKTHPCVLHFCFKGFMLLLPFLH